MTPVLKHAIICTLNLHARAAFPFFMNSMQLTHREATAAETHYRNTTSKAQTLQSITLSFVATAVPATPGLLELATL